LFFGFIFRYLIYQSTEKLLIMRFDLLNVKNAKTIKGEKKGYRTYILYLSPYKANDKGVNLCAMATKGCIESCLNTAGMGVFSTVQLSRLRKSNLFVENREYFIQKLVFEIETAIKLAKLDNMIPVFRLNGTSDIQWENIKLKDNKNIFELFPDVMWYDYTKIANRFDKKLPSNYHLTFSFSGEVDYYSGRIIALTKKILDSGNNVAVVFRKNLPETFLGYKVIDGDENDLRFTNETGVIIGLHAKGKAKKDTSGFVID
jgi:hypothetical protein